MADEKININGQEYDPEEVSINSQLEKSISKVETELEHTY